MDSSSLLLGSAPQILSPVHAQAPLNQRDPVALGKAFEGMFATMILKEMRKSLSQGMFPGDSSDILGGLFDQFIGTHIAQSGGFGIGNMIRHQLEHMIERKTTR